MLMLREESNKRLSIYLSILYFHGIDFHRCFQSSYISVSNPDLVNFRKSWLALADLYQSQVQLYRESHNIVILLNNKIFINCYLVSRGLKSDYIWWMLYLILQFGVSHKKKKKKNLKLRVLPLDKIMRFCASLSF